MPTDTPPGITNEGTFEKKPMFGDSDVAALKSQPSLSFGEKAVGLTFNPGGNSKVEAIKRSFADLIDQLESYRNPQNAERHPEVSRMLSVAITECQTAQMWAVKAVTWQY